MAAFTTNAAAWVAIAVTTGGGLLTTAIHYGSTNEQIQTIAQAQKNTESRVARHDDQLSAIQQQQAANAQKLQDIADAVHDIQSRVHRDDHR